ncbi:hypothetical protein C9374_004296 [Naegleria lovaniensis]|uniref:Peptidase S54 rhomboid domain-containing protein n=1 Tax=Naegleria lovaniensis TaxID=51637 RepID=A0AA88GT35_NAELO|nr:uncharacterized protein C9374_004296 [Naegleria lovaniensis]KAG2383625.1 hypothetical protein C9374_004296 [Naegleria lovaniensis]
MTNTSIPIPEHNSVILESIKKWFYEIPFATRCIFVVLTVVFFCLQCVFNWPEIDHVCLSYLDIMENTYSGAFRIVLYALFHANLMHYLFNIMAQLSLSSLLETHRFKSSIKLVACTCISIVLASVLQLVITFMMDAISLHIFGFNLTSGKFVNGRGANTSSMLSDFSMIHECSIGFSGVIFTYLTILSMDGFQSTQSLFGLVNVPSKLYPWILLLVTELLISNASFVGHLFGIIIGYVYVFVFERNTFISQHYENFLGRIEDIIIPSVVINLDCYWSNSQHKQNAPPLNSNGSIFAHMMETGQMSSSARHSNGDDYWERFTSTGRSLGYN